MDFRFSDDALTLAQGAADFLQGECPPERLRSTDRESLWPALADMGLIGTLAPESAGGLGLDATDFALIAEECGRVALPEPLVMVAGVSVPCVAATCPDELGPDIAGTHIPLPVHPLNPFTNLADQADGFVIATGESVYGVPASAATLRPQTSIDPNRAPFKVEATLTDDLKVGDASLADDMAARGAVFTAAELLGLTRAMIDQATEYAKGREQFGKPIGSFQAVKHHLATAFTKLEFARPVVYRAAASLGTPGARRDLAVSHAKLAANEAAWLAAETAIQVHGGMGYTFEVDLHYFMKRAYALCAQWGDSTYHTNRLDDLVLGGAIALGPSQTFAA
ncbi:MAG: acyl-CoA dehydrogenase family protein [Alphaproteobacteria bacterium]